MQHVPESKGKPREQQKQKTRYAFFQAALELCMQEQGFGALSLRKITKEAGKAPTAFYRHFTDTEALGKALVEEVLGNALAHLRTHMHLGRKRNFQRQIAKSVQMFFGAVDAHPIYWKFIASERFGGSQAVRDAIKAQIELFSTIMAEDLGLQPAFAHMTFEDRKLLAKIGVNLSFSWIIDWQMLVGDKEAKDAYLLHATRQMQMLFYGAYNWQSGAKTELFDKPNLNAKSPQSDE